jgi:hypothetical protein
MIVTEPDYVSSMLMISTYEEPPTPPCTTLDP